MPRIGRLTLATLLLVALGLVTGPAFAYHNDDVSSCTYASGTIRLHLAAKHVVQILAIGGQISYSDLSDNSSNGPCGAATTRNTDRVILTEGIAGSTRFQLRQFYGRFGPGATTEPTGVSEIEIDLGTVDDVWLLGRPVREVIRVGSDGINLNGDDDADIIGTSLAKLYAFLDDGDDVISAAGGRGTGDRWVPPPGGYLGTWGGSGADVITGTPRRDVLRGDLGTDRISGGGGADEISGGEDSDVLSGGGGNDYIDGRVLAGHDPRRRRRRLPRRDRPNRRRGRWRGWQRHVSRRSR